jgi:UDP-N-acetylglucosamine 2-epimerase (non-hydrolysing)
MPASSLLHGVPAPPAPVPARSPARPPAVLVVFGTRPELIKMAPVVHELRRQPERIRTVLCSTSQHRELLTPLLKLFALAPDYDLGLMRERQSLNALTSRLLAGLERVLREVRPDCVLVQGDTTTAMAAGLAAFHRRIRVAHVEAGLRTRDRHSPFPEELNRRLLASIADVHFAPTEPARAALLAESVPADRIHVTGNTGIDALLATRAATRGRTPALPDELLGWLRTRRTVLVTLHRRENAGRSMEQVCLALRDVVQRRPDVCVAFPVHPNPAVQEPVRRILDGAERVMLLPPLRYDAFVWLMEQCHLVLTDSGGIQEEAPALGKPVLVVRASTERGEGVASSQACLGELDRDRLRDQLCRLLDDGELYGRMARRQSLYGDGRAAPRIVNHLLALLEHEGAGKENHAVAAR